MRRDHADRLANEIRKWHPKKLVQVNRHSDSAPEPYGWSVSVDGKHYALRSDYEAPGASASWLLTADPDMLAQIAERLDRIQRQATEAAVRYETRGKSNERSRQAYQLFREVVEDRMIHYGWSLDSALSYADTHVRFKMPL